MLPDVAIVKYNQTLCVPAMQHVSHESMTALLKYLDMNVHDNYTMFRLIACAYRPPKQIPHLPLASQPEYFSVLVGYADIRILLMQPGVVADDL